MASPERQPKIEFKKTEHTRILEVVQGEKEIGSLAWDLEQPSRVVFRPSHPGGCLSEMSMEALEIIAMRGRQVEKGKNKR